MVRRRFWWWTSKCRSPSSYRNKSCARAGCFKVSTVTPPCTKFKGTFKKKKISKKKVKPIHQSTTTNVHCPRKTSMGRNSLWRKKTISEIPCPRKSKATVDKDKDSSSKANCKGEDSMKKPQSRTSKAASLTGFNPAGQWTVGDQVVARWSDGVCIYRQVMVNIVQMDYSSDQTRVLGVVALEAIANLLNVRPGSMLMDTLSSTDLEVKDKLSPTMETTSKLPLE